MAAASVFGYDLVAGKVSSDDNIVRQAGAGFALAMYLSHTRDLDTAGRVAPALDFYERQSLPFEDGRLVSADTDVANANAGAAALALLGCVTVSRRHLRQRVARCTQRSDEACRALFAGSRRSRAAR